MVGEVSVYYNIRPLMMQNSNSTTVEKSSKSVIKGSLSVSFLKLALEQCNLIFKLTKCLIDIVAKKLRVNNKVSDFIKEASVFNEWKDDTKRDNAIALGHDM